MKNYYDLLLDEKFDIVEEEVKQLLEDDKENSELWYLLFLASNNNYINFDKDNIKNEIAFNKAIEYASFENEAKYKSENFLYSNLDNLENFDKIFRYYQFKKYDECNELIDNIKDNNYRIISKKLLDSIKYVLDSYNSTKEYELQLRIYELLYKYSNNGDIKDIINNLKEERYYNFLQEEEKKQEEIRKKEEIKKIDCELNNLDKFVSKNGEQKNCFQGSDTLPGTKRSSRFVIFVLAGYLGGFILNFLTGMMIYKNDLRTLWIPISSEIFIIIFIVINIILYYIMGIDVIFIFNIILILSYLNMTIVYSFYLKAVGTTTCFVFSILSNLFGSISLQIIIFNGY